MIGWQALASRCGVDRDLAQRAVAQTLAAFSSKVAAMSTSEARSALCLDLGPCGKLRIVRAGGMKTGFEPRVAFSGGPPPRHPPRRQVVGAVICTVVCTIGN